MKHAALILGLLFAAPAAGTLVKADLVGVWQGKLIFKIADATHETEVGVTFRDDWMVALAAGGRTEMAAWVIEGERVRIKAPRLPANDVLLRDVVVTLKTLEARLSKTVRLSLARKAQ